MRINGYIGSIIIISVFGSVLCSFLRYGGKMKKYTGFVLCVAIVSSLLSPIYSIIGFVGRIDEFFSFEFKTEQTESGSFCQEWIVEETDDELRQAVADIAKVRFDIPLNEDNITIRYNTDDFENVDIEHIEVNINNITVIKNLNEFCSYFSDMLLCVCEVVEG